MQYEDQKVNLIINKLTKTQYQNLREQEKINDNELYMISDESDSRVSKIAAGSNIAISPSTGVGEVTISANVPTKTSQLTNDSGFALTSQIPSTTVNLSGTYEDGTTFSYNFLIK